MEQLLASSSWVLQTSRWFCDTWGITGTLMGLDSGKVTLTSPGPCTLRGVRGETDDVGGQGRMRCLGGIRG